MRPAADDVLELWPVSRAVNSVRNNGANLLDRNGTPQPAPAGDEQPGGNPA